MKLSDIKIGANYRDTKKATHKDDCDIIIVVPFPSFCNSEWLIAEDLATKEKLYLLVRDGIIVDVTKDDSKTYDHERAERTLNFILFGA